MVLRIGAFLCLVVIAAAQTTTTDTMMMTTMTMTTTAETTAETTTETTTPATTPATFSPDLAAQFMDVPARDVRRQHFYCLPVNMGIQDFPQILPPNADGTPQTPVLWAIFLQYPILSYLDSIRKGYLFEVVAGLVQSGATSGPLRTIQANNLCVARVTHYGVSTFEESILINIYFQNITANVTAFDAAFQVGLANARSTIGSPNNYIQRYLDREALAIDSVINMTTTRLAMTNMNSHPRANPADPTNDPTLRAIFLGSYEGGATIDTALSAGPNFAENPNPINFGLEAGDIVFAVFGSIFLVIVGGLTLLGFCIHPFFLA